MPLRGPVRSIYSVPTIIIFCEGLGIATARALIEAEPSVGSLNFPLRQAVRLYYRVSSHGCWGCTVELTHVLGKLVMLLSLS